LSRRWWPWPVRRRIQNAVGAQKTCLDLALHVRRPSLSQVFRANVFARRLFLTWA
jgi:hypothetical protein